MIFTETLKKNHEFRRLYAKGKSSVTPYLVVYAGKGRQRQRQQLNRVGFTVSAKLGGAVTRNRIRRRLRELYRLHETEFRAGAELVVVARKSAAGAQWRQLERAFLSACRKLNLLREDAV